jgi:hypothetical protein
MKALIYSTLALALVVFSSAQLLNADVFVGKWILEKKVKHKGEDFKPGTKSLDIQRVSEGYYRAETGDNENLLLKEVSDTQLYSDIEPKIDVNMRLLDKNHFELTMYFKSGDPDTSITIFKRVTGKK